MKTWLSLVALLVLCLSLAVGVACGGGKEKEEGVTEIKFGIALPFGGIYGAVVGIPAKKGFELLAEKIGVFEVGGKQYRWKLIFEDNLGTSAAGGLASATKFIYDDRVDFMLQSGDASIAAQRRVLHVDRQTTRFYNGALDAGGLFSANP